MLFAYSYLGRNLLQALTLSHKLPNARHALALLRELRGSRMRPVRAELPVFAFDCSFAHNHLSFHIRGRYILQNFMSLSIHRLLSAPHHRLQDIDMLHENRALRIGE